MIILTRKPIEQSIANSAMVYTSPFRFGSEMVQHLLALIWSFFMVLSISRKMHVHFIETHNDYSHYIGFIFRKLGYGWIAELWDHPAVYLSNHRLLAKLQLDFLKRFLKRATLVITLEGYLDDFELPSNILVEHVNGIVMSEDSCNKETNTQEKPKRIIYVGQLMLERGISTLIKAFKEIAFDYPDATLLLVGPIESHKELILSSIKNSGVADRITLTGKISHAEVLDLIESSSIGVYPFPYRPYLDCVFPVKVLEYMSCGIPVVASNLKGVRKYIEDSVNGLLFEPENYIEMASKIKELLSNNRLRTEMGNKACLKALEFRWESINEFVWNATLAAANRSMSSVQ